MGHHHGHPLTGAMELRPDHWSTTLKSHLEISRIYTLTIDELYSINQEGFNMHTHTHTHTHTHIYIYIDIYIYIYHIPAPHNPPVSYSQWIHTNPLFSNHEYGTPSHITTMPLWYQPSRLDHSQDHIQPIIFNPKITQFLHT